jgi:hypothetical protein
LGKLGNDTDVDQISILVESIAKFIIELIKSDNKLRFAPDTTGWMHVLCCHGFWHKVYPHDAYVKHHISGH